MTTSTFSPALHEWARRRPAQTASKKALGSLRSHTGKERLVAALRNTAEPAFMASVVELEGDRG